MSRRPAPALPTAHQAKLFADSVSIMMNALRNDGLRPTAINMSQDGFRVEFYEPPHQAPVGDGKSLDEWRAGRGCGAS